MASRRQDRRRSCTSKRRYVDQTAACNTLRHMGWPKDMHTYKCGYCGFWHVGHVPWYVKKAIKARKKS